MSNCKKIIQMTGEYNCIFDSKLVHGFGNISCMTGTIYAYKLDGNYVVEVYNTSEWNVVYLPHGCYTYTICGDRLICKSNGEIIDENTNIDIDDFFMYTPVGWDLEMCKKLVEVLLELKG